MCLAIPGKIISINGRGVTVQYPGNQTRPALLGQPDLQVGDYVLVQMGIAIQKVNAHEAKQAQKAWLLTTA